MKHIALAAMLWLIGGAAVSDDLERPDRKTTEGVARTDGNANGAAERQVRAIAREYQSAMDAYQAAVQRPTTNSRRPKAFPKQPVADGYATRMLEVANQAPKGPAAFQALGWIMKNAGGPKMAAAQDQAVGILLRDHLADPQMAELCKANAASRSPAAETLLRGVLAKSPSRQAQGQACLALAAYLRSKADWADYCKFADAHQRELMASNPEGKAMLERLAEVNADQLRDESKELYRRAAREFAATGAPKVGKRANAAATVESGLPVGAKAPDIFGKDLNGKALRLSDFRGKVVLVDFWAQWCVYSRALLRRERELMSRMQGRNFALVGVNGDRDLEAARQLAEEVGMNWPSWRDGSPDGPIAREWKVTRCPTTFVVDQRGVIRFKNLNGKELDEAIESLLKEDMAK